jgi:hypothetical protein
MKYEKKSNKILIYKNWKWNEMNKIMMPYVVS